MLVSGDAMVREHIERMINHISLARMIYKETQFIFRYDIRYLVNI